MEWIMDQQAIVGVNYHVVRLSAIIQDGLVPIAGLFQEARGFRTTF